MHGMEKLRPLALLLLRLALGVIFIYNGYPKLFGRTRQAMYEMVHDNGLPAYFAYIAGVLELGGGAALLAGLCTQFLGLLLAGEMAIAIWKGDHFFARPLAVGRYELTLALAVGAFALGTFGAGSISLDAALCGSGTSKRRTKTRS